MALLQKASGSQPSSTDLTAIAALTPSNDDVLQRKSGAWTNRTPAQLATDLSVGSSPLPYHVVIPATVIPTAATGSTTLSYQANSMYNAQIQGGVAQNNYIEWTVAVAAGTYTMRVLIMKNINSGIITIAIDGGSDLGTSIDGYNASLTTNNATDFTGIALTAGLHTVRFKAASKNGSSSNYAMNIQGFSLTRTGA